MTRCLGLFSLGMQGTRALEATAYREALRGVAPSLAPTLAGGALCRDLTGALDPEGGMQEGAIGNDFSNEFKRDRFRNCNG